MTKFIHANINSKDYKKLAEFYINVFDCKPILPERDMEGKWLDDAIGVKNAKIKGVHLQLPGFGEGGPTLELFQYEERIKNTENFSNKDGIGHIAFRVDDVEETLKNILANGGSKLGEITQTELPRVGMLTLIYTKDPEGNIVEIQSIK